MSSNLLQTLGAGAINELSKMCSEAALQLLEYMKQASITISPSEKGGLLQCLGMSLSGGGVSDVQRRLVEGLLASPQSGQRLICDDSLIHITNDTIGSWATVSDAGNYF